MDPDLRSEVGSAARDRVTLIIPVRNEAAHIDECLRSAVEQAYPTDLLEIIVVDGDSTDDTRARLEAWAAHDPRIRLMRNPDRLMVPGLNMGLAAASGTYVGCVSGHSALPRDYVQACVAALRAHRAWGVGVAIERVGTTPLQTSIGRAQSHPFGVGGAFHNYGGRSGWAEATFPGFWPRWVFDRVGWFDPRMRFNEDNELSHRIGAAGGRLWYEPSVRVRYHPRSSLAALFRQYRAYGAGKVTVFIAHPQAMRPRHMAPAALVAGLTSGAILAVALAPLRVPIALLAIAYVGSALGAAAMARRPGERTLLIAAAFITMHMGYGIGTWSGAWSAAVRALRNGGRESPEIG